MGAFSSSYRETGLGFPFGTPPLSIKAEDKIIKPSSRNPSQVYPPCLKASMFLSSFSFILQASQGKETMIHNDSCILVAFLL